MSCGSADEDAAESSAEPAPEGSTASLPPARAQVDPALVGTEWLLTSLDGEELLPKTEITLEIDKEEAGGSSGCNLYGGDVDKMKDGSVVWPGGTYMTTIGCADDLQRQETRYLNLLDEVEAYRIEDDRLELMDAEGRTNLVVRQEVQWRSDPPKLVGTSWMLRSTDGRQPREGSVPTVRFEADKKVFWYDGCGNFEGQYFVTENDLTVPNFGVADQGCMKPEAFEDPEGPCVVGCFGPEGDYRLRDGLLEIRTEAGESTSILEPIPEGQEPKQRGTPWELRYFVENGEKTPVVGDALVTLTFDRGTLRREGAVFGSTGCNDYRAAYEYPTRHNTFERIVVDDPVSTRRACPKSQRIAAQEQRFLAVVGDLGEYPNVSMDGQLELETRDGRKLNFSAPERERSPA
jgi:heat shock protein HslJ